LYLLSQFQCSESHKLIIDLFSLPGDLPYVLFSDTVTEAFPEILIKTCNGSIDEIKKLAFNPNADEFCRSGAMRVINFAVAAGYITREDALLIYREVFENRMSFRNSDFFSFIADNLCDIYPAEMMDLIKECYKEGSITQGIISLSNFNDVLNKGKELCLEKLDESYKRIFQKDIHDNMEWWACFDNSRGSKTAFFPTLPGSASKANKKVKNKRKMIKASKKKNRKKNKKKR